ncbi:hypothetical protein M9Y10_036916 [Tritrichomonas musculus]|uniref:Initiator binding domain-containing protein n=1 Tax=Tritrichomonas musculus TaxID=1915356 RepID=A0ABR2GTC0_9EUKA
MKELGIKKEDMAIFTPPKCTCDRYQRSIIYSINKYQFELLQNVIEFEPGINTVEKMRKSLIIFLDLYKEFQDTNYFFIFFKFAHQFYLNNYSKVLITNIQFQSSQKSKTSNCKMSFTNKPIHHAKVEEIPATQESDYSGNKNDIDYTPVLYDNDSSDNFEYQVLQLCLQFNALTIK